MEDSALEMSTAPPHLPQVPSFLSPFMVYWPGLFLALCHGVLIFKPLLIVWRFRGEGSATMLQPRCAEFHCIGSFVNKPKAMS